jgi:hypothetical protein
VDFFFVSHLPHAVDRFISSTVDRLWTARRCSSMICARPAPARPLAVRA